MRGRNGKGERWRNGEVKREEEKYRKGGRKGGREGGRGRWRKEGRSPSSSINKVYSIRKPKGIV